MPQQKQQRKVGRVYSLSGGELQVHGAGCVLYSSKKNVTGEDQVVSPPAKRTKIGGKWISAKESTHVRKGETVLLVFRVYDATGGSNNMTVSTAPKSLTKSRGQPCLDQEFDRKKNLQNEFFSIKKKNVLKTMGL